ncbi:MAG TPA: hypothetical protein ENH48_04170 [Halieaceae bacterium]|nr:MAG: hypothetical protein DRQ98_03380 [Gammaproteobacteria bacterium]HDY82138.1 hypothetical protein [Halieaceae bacterium]
MKLRLNIVFAVVMSAVMVSGCSEKNPESAQVVAPVRLSDVGWRLHGHDVGEQRYSKLDQINRDTVDKLGLTWSFDMYTRRGVEATPLVRHGVSFRG